MTMNLEDFQQILSMNYEWLRAIHIIAIISWMAGLLYLPRLFVYHTGAEKGSELSETLKIMEGRLLRIIMNPAMIISWVLGLLLLWANPDLLKEAWMHLKLTAILLLSASHGIMAKYRRLFANDICTKSDTYFRVLNEIPTILMIIIVVCAVAQPF